MKKRITGENSYIQNGDVRIPLQAGDSWATTQDEERVREFLEREKAKLRAEQIRGTDFSKYILSNNQLINKEFKKANKITPTMLGNLLECGVRISYKKGPLGGYKIMRSVNSQVEASFGDMRTILAEGNEKLSPKNTNEMIKKMINSNLIFANDGREKLEDGTVVKLKKRNEKGNFEKSTFELNPAFFAKGHTEKDIEHIKIYFKKFKEFTKLMSQAEKGFLLEIIPYFNIHHHCLCSNPNEGRITNLKFFTRKTLAKEVGSSYASVKTKVANLINIGVLGEFNTYGTKALYLNPDLIFKKDVEFEDFQYTEEQRNKFEIAKQMREQGILGEE